MRVGVAVASALAPEPFMGALRAGHVAVQAWLQECLGGASPNAVHHALAYLALDGAKVWTVNFDWLIETAIPDLKVASWPQHPDGTAQLLKPHGSLGGDLIFTADQVLGTLEEAWLNRLRADTFGRTVVFIGYSGRDLDFQPLWDDVLAEAKEVIWFERRDPSDPKRVVDEDRKRSMLRAVEARGALSFPPPDRVSGNSNPSWDFVIWCRQQGLIPLADGLLLLLQEPRREQPLPRLRGDLSWARASVAGDLGDYRTMRSQYLQIAWRRRSREALRLYLRSLITHGGRITSRLLLAAYLLPPLGNLRQGREMLLRKRLTALHRLAQHRAVLRRTAHIPDYWPSTWLILRASSLRITGSLDESEQIASAALVRARSEHHVVRSTHAAFQKAMALLWAERIDEATHCLESELEPLASIAANRWVAWAQFVDGALAVRRGATAHAIGVFRLAEERFLAEGLIDGALSVMVARLAAHRQSKDRAAFDAELAQIHALGAQRHSGQLFYARRNRFTEEAVLVEAAEFARCHDNALTHSLTLYRQLATSRFPIHGALGHLGVALTETDSTARASATRQAATIAAMIGFRLVEGRAQLLADGDWQSASKEIFFC